GVDGDELDAPEAELDHPVHRVHATAADADDLDDGEVVLVRSHVRPPGENLQPLLEVRSLSQYCFCALTVSAREHASRATPRVSRNGAALSRTRVSRRGRRPCRAPRRRTFPRP